MIPSARHIPWIHRHRCRETASHTPWPARPCARVPPARSHALSQQCDCASVHAPLRFPPSTHLTHCEDCASSRYTPCPVHQPVPSSSFRLSLSAQGRLLYPASTPASSQPLRQRFPPLSPPPRIPGHAAGAPTLSLLRYCFSVRSSTHRSLSRHCTVYPYCRQLDRTDYHSTRARAAFSYSHSVSTITGVLLPPPPLHTFTFTFPSPAVQARARARTVVSSGELCRTRTSRPFATSSTVPLHMSLAD
ncbi:hypothetical protein C8Q73DRAFT_57875 [Cubamyces lactineus]|nr:hypothetical protein C8Q73DRAFT_57875 [Cubamyces lactineus]